MKEEIAKKVRDWLVEEGIYKDKIADENADFHFLAEVPPNSRQFIDVIFPKNREDMLVIASGIKLSDDHYRSVMSLGDAKREELLWEIRFKILFLETGFQILPNARDPQLFQFTREIYFDGLNKNLFMDAIRQVHKCKLFIIWMMQRSFGGHEGSDLIMYR
ncbi:DUF2299 domain-containing protein [Archaeoglobus neptunius]|uniref:DUF2299 domain-containing protein n=1 Tax=Archaeoglobus neptunius TaxID=2798580 RepID=UPI0019273663|nr:DUF2299 domain-containing protein [Archaeoglobus neptunius]